MSDASLEIPNPVVADDNELRRTLGPVHLTMIGIGAIIGAGIFVLTGHAAAGYAGPGVVISFAIAGLLHITSVSAGHHAYAVAVVARHHARALRSARRR